MPDAQELLSKVTKTYTTPDNSATFEMLPFTTVKVDINNRQFHELTDKPQDELNFSEVSFLTFESYLRSLRVTDDAPGSLRLLALYREQSEREQWTLAERWQVWQQIANTQALNVFWDAYDATRDVPIVQETPDGDDTGEPVGISAN